MSGLVNKVKEALHSDKSSSTTHSQPEGTSGPHGSRVGNAADPRVDSDRDHRANPTGGLGSSHTTHGSAIGTSAPGGVGDNRGYDGPASTTDGPHSSNLANKADPRVDSDRDYSKNLGANSERSANVGSNTHSTGSTGFAGTTGHSSGTAGHSSTLGSGTGHSSLGSNTGAPEGTYGQHSSRVANAADPRIDSDRDHRSAPGQTFGTTNTTGRTGGLGDPHTAGHSAGTHTAGYSSHTTGTTGGLTGSIAPGPAPNTAGPHKSDALNKVDPRVDSNLDGSKTYGGDKTYAPQ